MTAPKPSAPWERVVSTRLSRKPASPTCPARSPRKNLSPSLLTSLKIAGTHARNHPAILIPAVCRAVEAEHLPVFKRQGKLHTGPARPHPLPLNAVLAERPAVMVAWIRENSPAKLEGLWKSVLPEGSTAPPAEYAADLFWLLHQGHILLYTDDTLVVQEAREAHAAEPSGEPKKKKKKKSKKAKPAAEAKEGEEPAAESPQRSPPPKQRKSPVKRRPGNPSKPRNPLPQPLLKPKQRLPPKIPAPVEDSPTASAAVKATEPETEHEETHPFAD